MEAAFGTVLFAVVGLAAVIAIVVAATSRGLYDEIGKGGLDVEPAPPEPTGAGGAAIRDEEVRQMLEARNARRARRGQPPLDVEAQLAELTRGASPAPHADPALVAEVRQAVRARNARRARRGEPPLDVEAEVARTLAEHG